MMLCMFKCNLFPVKAAATKGNVVKFGAAKCWIFGKNGTLYGVGTVADKLYYLNTARDHTAVASQPHSGSIDLWHQHLGHLNGAQLKEMTTHDMVKGMRVAKGENLFFCENCVEEKISRQPYQSVGEIRSVRKLQCVHSDVCGPMSTESIDTLSLLLMITQDVVGCTLLGVSKRC